jgi:EamA-like transporter family.
MKKFVPFLMVCVGAVSYGVPASLVKISISDEKYLPLLITSMLFFASIILTIVSSFFDRKYNFCENKAPLKLKLILFVSGFSIFCTNYFYMNSLSYVSVSIAAVLLMQSVWITPFFQFIFKGIRITRSIIFQVLFVLIGTVLATNVLQDYKISVVGILLGIASAISYSVTLYATSCVSENISSVSKSKFMIYGAFTLSLFPLLIQSKNIHENVLYVSSWGAVISLFSVLIPLLSFTFFMSKIPGSLGPLISSFELPSAIFFGYILLGETVNLSQIVGIFIIIFTISFSSIRASLNYVDE